MANITRERLIELIDESRKSDRVFNWVQPKVAADLILAELSKPAVASMNDFTEEQLSEYLKFANSMKINSVDALRLMAWVSLRIEAPAVATHAQPVDVEQIKGELSC